MSQRYQHLLSPIKVGNHVLKNRMLYPNASPHVLQGSEPFPAQGYRAFHAGLARNGAAVVTIAEWCNPEQHKGPAEMDFTHMQSFDMSDPSNQNYFSLMAEEIHFYGSKLLVCAEVDWPDGYSLYGGRRPGPPIPGAKENEPIPVERIPEVIDGFVKKMRLYKNLGYDGMTIRCDMQILPQGVHRDDAYSNETLEDCSRFIREIYAAVKKEFGGDFITEAEIAWEQPYGYGPNPTGVINSDDVLKFCQMIDKDVDIFQIREHDGCRSHPTGFNFMQGEHPALDFAVRMREAGSTALLEPIGGFQEPDEMEQDLIEGKCDMFGMARAFMADPEYGIKMQEGRGEDITPCIKCNKCHGTIQDKPDPWVGFCSVNPKHGLQHDLNWLVPPVGQSKKVAVIGGGCAGMRAAIVAAQRGHSVTLYERTGRLGGQLLHADFFDFKWPLKNYKNWLIRQLGEWGVKVVMNCAPTTDEITAGGYDAVLAATGADPKLPGSIRGLRDENGKALYPTCDDIWGHEQELGDHVVIVGGSETGIETAIYLLRAGHKVTMLTRQKCIAHDCSRLHYITMAFIKEDADGGHHEAAEWERYDRFESHVSVTTTAVNGNTVTYVDADGTEHQVTADNIVICGGHRALKDEALAYASCASQFFAIGDCVGAGNVQVCNRQAYARATLI